MSEEFSAGVNILLQRMETHPEEFYDAQSRGRLGTDPKWHNVMTSVMQVKFKENARGEAIYLTDAEVDALFAKYTKLRRKAFDDHVLDAVLNPEQVSSDDIVQAKIAAMQKMTALQAQYGQQGLQGIGQRGMYDVATNQMQGWSDPSNVYSSVAQAKAQHIAAHQEALMNAYPYATGEQHPQPMSESMLSRMAKGLGFK
jgi:hypothetical protein